MGWGVAAQRETPSPKNFHRFLADSLARNHVPNFKAAALVVAEIIKLKDLKF